MNAEPRPGGVLQPRGGGADGARVPHVPSQAQVPRGRRAARGARLAPGFANLKGAESLGVASLPAGGDDISAD